MKTTLYKTIILSYTCIGIKKTVSDHRKNVQLYIIYERKKIISNSYLKSTGSQTNISGYYSG